MTGLILAALSFSILLYLTIGVWYGARVQGLTDIFPLVIGRTARVNNHREFAASTVATTISLATVVVAFYELVPFLGPWLIWTAITTSFGLFLFGLCARRIWTKMSTYHFRPTIHSYLGHEFDSKGLAFVASIFTAVGYLSAFAVELSVGSRFLAGLIENAPTLLTAVIIAAVSFIYTGLGGFRVVVVTDRVQMWFIWSLIIALCGYEAIMASQQGWTASVSHIPNDARALTWRSGLPSFLFGIAVMNSLLFISNMSLWQRIAGSQEPDVVTKGMWSSVIGSGLSWSLLILTAVGAFMFVVPVPNENLLVTLLKSMQYTSWGHLVIFVVVLGLYGAMLSTASTQLIAVSHTLYEDVIAPFRQADLRERAESKVETFWSRAILVSSALAAVGVVEGLRAWGFTVADLAFAVYGAALGLVPPVMLTLFVSRDTTRRLSIFAAWAVALGFISCWSAAAYGRSVGDTTLVFISPIVSTGVATLVMVVGWTRVRLFAPAHKTEPPQGEATVV